MTGPLDALAGHRLLGMPVVVTPTLPADPGPGEDARRIVRHGLRNVLEWLGEPVGPRPGDPTNALQVGPVLYVSPALADALDTSPHNDVTTSPHNDVTRHPGVTSPRHSTMTYTPVDNSI